MITMQINYEIKLYDDYAHCFVKHHILLSHHYTKTVLLTSFFFNDELVYRVSIHSSSFYGQQMNTKTMRLQ
jgi:hypothetical protein